MKKCDKLLRQYQVDRLRDVASNELADSETRSAATCALQEHEAYLERIQSDEMRRGRRRHDIEVRLEI